MFIKTWGLFTLLSTLDVARSQCSDVSSVIAHDGTPTGTMQVINGSKYMSLEILSCSTKDTECHSQHVCCNTQLGRSKYQ